MAYILKAHLYRAQNNDIIYAPISWQLLSRCRPRGLLADTPNILARLASCWPSLPDWQETQLPALASPIRRLRLGAGLKQLSYTQAQEGQHETHKSPNISKHLKTSSNNLKTSPNISKMACQIHVTPGGSGSPKISRTIQQLQKHVIIAEEGQLQATYDFPGGAPSRALFLPHDDQFQLV